MINEAEKLELKKVIQESITEVFEQKRDYFLNLFDEVVSDKAFLKVTKEGESSDSVSRNEVFDSLK